MCYCTCDNQYYKITYDTLLKQLVRDKHMYKTKICNDILRVLSVWVYGWRGERWGAEFTKLIFCSARHGSNRHGTTHFLAQPSYFSLFTNVSVFYMIFYLFGLVQHKNFVDEISKPGIPAYRHKMIYHFHFKFLFF